MKKVKNKKIRQLMEVARELFWKHGLKRVSIEEICQKAGVSKMTFYRHFDNKIDLAKAIFEKIVEQSVQQFKAIMADDSTTSEEKMEQMIRLKLEGTNDIGKEFMQDFYNSPELGMVQYINEMSGKVWLEMINDFKDAQKNGWFRKDFKPEAFFIISQKLADMANDEQLQSLYNNPQEVVMELTRLLSYGIMPRNDKKD
jgi:AcrR family transcriptional regulator